MAQNGTSSASFTVSLRPQFSDLADGSNDLMPKIVLINQQREGFRNVTEEQLQLEMNQMEDDEASSSASDGEGDGDVKKGTTESIYHKRLQMARSLGHVPEPRFDSHINHSLVPRESTDYLHLTHFPWLPPEPLNKDSKQPLQRSKRLYHRPLSVTRDVILSHQQVIRNLREKKNCYGWAHP
jgi:hypothetical protein